ncbi:phage integrase SAM-like domain-containing protein [Flavobacterium sp.]|uniref:phage integrase SAM-like domain-containing protein n=1 Tax=Flavobacterium sp. TaxID=239 RepID=UPI0037523243
MAKIKFLLQSKSENSNIYARYSINRATVLKRKTGFIISAKDWSIDKAQPKMGREDLKILKSKLDKLAIFINDAHNEGISKGIEFNGDWLQLQIDTFNNKIAIVELDVLTNYIQKFIDDAPYKQNAKKELGLSKGRVQNLKLFKKTILRYETEIFKGKNILIKDINLLFVEKFKIWLFNKGYSVNYVGKNIANIKTICIDAHKNDIEISTQLKNVKKISESKPPEQIITLNEDEQELIKRAPLIREALINARKWILLGCLIGQRGGDLLNITNKNIKELNGIKIIELKQQKTGKLVAIPLLPDALEIIENDFPYKISITRFNEYIKDVCESGGLTQMVFGSKSITTKTGKKIISEKTGELIDEKIKLNVSGMYKKYELITSHVCRRSFATNFYGRIPTPILMNITAHGTERMFLNYIGKTTYDNAYQMLEYFSKLAPRDKTPVMEVIKNTAN